MAFPNVGPLPIPPQGPGYYDNDQPPMHVVDVDHDYDGNYDAGHGSKAKQNKKNAAVESLYKGFILEKAKALPGERSSWSRVRKTALPADDKKLARMSKKIRAETRIGPMTAFSRLTTDQRRIISELTDECQREGKSKNAEWVLDGVQKIEKRQWSSRTPDVDSLWVILKRMERSKDDKGAQKYLNVVGSNKIKDDDIIDLVRPTKKSGKNEKPGKKNQNHGDPFGHENDYGGHPQFHDDPRGGMQNFFSHPPQHDPNMPPMVPPPPPNMRDRLPPMQHGLPPGPMPIPVDQWQPEQQPHHYNGPEYHAENPFQPNRDFPGPYEMPPTMNGRDDHLPPHVRTAHRSRSRSSSRSREIQRQEAQRQLDKARRHNQRLERKVDDLQERFDGQMEQVIRKVGEWNVDNDRRRDSLSTEDSLRDRDFWSPPASRGSHTPPSSPGLSSLYPRKSSRYTGGRRYNGGFEDAIIEPYNSSRQHRRRTSDFDRQSHKSRPKIHHANTYANDYPSRLNDYPPRLNDYPPRLTDYPEDDYGYADFNNKDRGHRMPTSTIGRSGARWDDERRYVGEERGGRRGYRS